MQVLIKVSELARLRELEVLMFKRLECDTAKCSTSKVLKMAGMRINMYAHMHAYLNVYQQKLSHRVLQHIEQPLNRPPLQLTCCKALASR